MTDIVIDQTEQLPLATQVRYKDMGDGTYALVTYAGPGSQTELVVNVPGTAAPQALLVDPIHLALAVTDALVYEAHVGHLWRTSTMLEHTDLLADNGLHQVYITTGTKEVHLHDWIIGYPGDCELHIYRVPVVVPDTGSILTSYNLRDTIHTNPEAVLRLNPTVINYGTEIYRVFVGGGSGPKALGGVGAGDSVHTILSDNSSYIFEIVNVSGAAGQFSQGFVWNEEERL